MAFVRLQVNPANPRQRYRMTDSGRIDALDEAVPVPTGDNAPRTWFDYKPPFLPARAFWITDWNTPKGFTLDFLGGLHPFGGQAMPNPPPPYFTANGYWARDLWVHADGTKGYVLSEDGTVYSFGGAPGVNAPPVADRMARRLAVQWSNNLTQIKGYVLDGYGGLHHFGPANPSAASPFYQPGWDIARAIRVVDWNSAPPKILIMDGKGGFHSVGYEYRVDGGPYWPDWEIAYDFALLSGGQSGQKTEVALLDGVGVLHQWLASSPPTVTITSPGATVTNTTRPRLTWTMASAQGLRQTAYRARIYAGTHATVPLTNDDLRFFREETTTSITSISTDVDLPNGPYTAFVALRDNADVWSAWKAKTFSMNVTPLGSPGLTATPVDDGVLLALSPGSGHLSTSRYRIEFLGQDGAWYPVRGASSMRSNESVTDREGPYAVPRSYRAIHFREVGAGLYLGSPPSTAATATPLGEPRWSLTDLRTGVVRRIYVRGPVSFEHVVESGVFYPLGATTAVVLSDGVAKGRRASLSVYSFSAADFEALTGLLRPGKTVLLRDAHGRALYVQVADNVRASQEKWAPEPGEPFPVGHAYVLDVPLVEVARPSDA